MSHRNWYLDPRSTPPAARTWLDTPRPKREIGTDFPPPGDQVNLLRSADLVVHLHQIRPSRRLDRDAAGQRPHSPGMSADPLPTLEKAARPLRTVEPTSPFDDLRPWEGRWATPNWSASDRPPTAATTSSPSGIGRSST
ncbi:hypothetical protein ACWD04_05720 [Streptomyces sp. NPDC002911]